MKQEHWLATIIGLIILAYLLDSVVNPLTIELPTPYHFFVLQTLLIVPFTTTSIVIKAIAIIIIPFLFFSFMNFKKTTRGIILLIVSGLLQLYALQDVATGARTIPLEWSLSLTLAGAILFIPTIFFFLLGMGETAGKVISEDSSDDFSL